MPHYQESLSYPRSIPEPVDDGFEHIVGRGLELSAHGLSLLRGVGSFDVSRKIIDNPDYQSWGLVARFSMYAATDAEGIPARHGRYMQGKNPNEHGAFNTYMDKLPDKMLVDMTTTAIAYREYMNGNYLYASCAGLAAGLFTARDIWSIIDGIKAEKEGINSAAIPFGKQVTREQYGLTGAAVSPFGRLSRARLLIGAGYLVVAERKLASGASLKHHIDLQRAAND